MFDENLHQETILALKELKIKSLKPENADEINAIGARLLYYISQFLSSLSSKDISRDDIPFYLQLNKHVYDLLHAGLVKDDEKELIYLGKSIESIAETLEFQGVCKLTYELENKIMQVIETINREYS